MFAPKTVGVLRIRGDPRRNTSRDSRCAVSPVTLRQVDAGVVRAVEAALVGCRVHQRVDPVRLGSALVARPMRAGLAPGNPWLGQPLPGAAAVSRFVEAAAGAVGRRIDIPRRPPRLPQRGVDDLGFPVRRRDRSRRYSRPCRDLRSSVCRRPSSGRRRARALGP